MCKLRVLAVNKLELSVSRIAMCFLNYSYVIMVTAGPRYARTAIAKVQMTTNAIVKCATSALLIWPITVTAMMTWHSPVDQLAAIVLALAEEEVLKRSP